MLDRFHSLFLFLGSQSEEGHLKSTVDDHDNRNGCRKTEDKFGCITDNLRDIAETHISASELIGISYSTEYSSIIRSENPSGENRGKKSDESIKKMFHTENY